MRILLVASDVVHARNDCVRQIRQGASEVTTVHGITGSKSILTVLDLLLRLVHAIIVCKDIAGAGSESWNVYPLLSSALLTNAGSPRLPDSLGDHGEEVRGEYGIKE